MPTLYGKIWNEQITHSNHWVFHQCDDRILLEQLDFYRLNFKQQALRYTAMFHTKDGMSGIDGTEVFSMGALNFSLLQKRSSGILNRLLSLLSWLQQARGDLDCSSVTYAESNSCHARCSTSSGSNSFISPRTCGQVTEHQLDQSLIRLSLAAAWTHTAFTPHWISLDWFVTVNICTAQ